MSELDDLVEEIHAEQMDRQRYVLEVGGPEDEARGIDVVVKPGEGRALVARVSWGEGDIAVDLKLYIDGDEAAQESAAIDGTTSVWATRE